MSCQRPFLLFVRGIENVDTAVVGIAGLVLLVKKRAQKGENRAVDSYVA